MLETISTMRYIIDVEDICRTFKTELMIVLNYNSTLTQAQYETIDFIYKDAINQIVSEVNHDVYSFLSKLDAIIDLTQLIALGVPTHNLPIYASVYKASAFQLCLRILDLTNPNKLPVTYIPDAVTDSYIVVLATPPGYNI